MRYFLYDFTFITAALPVLIWFRPKWLFESRAARKPIRGGALVISNHSGFFDPIYLLAAVWYRRHHMLCMKEFFDRPVIGRLFRWFHCIPVDRQNFGMGTLRDIVEILKKGKVVSLFPEGHVSAGQLASFKSGMVLMALQSRTPIVPVYIKAQAKWWHRAVFVIGEPIDLVARFGERPNFAQIDEMTALLRDKEAQLAAVAEKGGK